MGTPACFQCSPFELLADACGGGDVYTIMR